jgi:hypothetical protein
MGRRQWIFSCPRRFNEALADDCRLRWQAHLETWQQIAFIDFDNNNVSKSGKIAVNI